MFRRIISAVLGDAGRAAPAPPSADRYPEPIDFIELLKHQMAANLQNITADRAIVPGHYTVLLHAEAHRRLRPLFKEICKAAAEELTREVDRLREIPYGYRPDARGPRPKADREIYPLDYTWSIEMRPVLYAPDGSDIPKGYMAVATDLINERGAEIVDEEDGDGTKMTVKNPFSGVFETQFVHTASLRETSNDDSVTVEVPYARRPTTAPAAAPAASRKTYALVYRHPVTQQTFTHQITKPVTTIGRVTDTNADIDLRIAVEVQVSEEHAKLRVDPASGRVDILDVSSYGTTVNGQTVPPSNPARHNENWTPVPDGAEIGLAGYVFLTLRADLA